MSDDVTNDASALDTDLASKQPEADAHEAAVAANGHPREECLIFISYRVDPDAPLAAAVKALLETTLPGVTAWTSNQGGIRPSASGSKPQIQAAMRRAKAVIGIITEASKGREWVFYEAGAAFGRNVVYVPLLVGIPPKDLPSTIADYQAYSADDRAQMELLLSSLAEDLGRDMKPFLPRFNAFRKRLDARRRLEEEAADDDEGEANEGRSPDVAALVAMFSGHVDEGTKAFAALEKAATDPDDVVRYRVLPLWYRAKATKSGVLLAMEKFEPALKETNEFAFWTGFLEDRPTIAIPALRRAIDSHRHRALTVLADKLYSTGHESEALELLLGGFRDTNRELSVDCAMQLARLPHPWVQPLARLLAMVEATLTTHRAEVTAGALKAAEDVGCHYLAVELAYRRDDAEGSATSLNDLGRSFSAAGLTSLAYRAFLRAIDKGASVARVNAANLVGNGAVPAAALELLDQHSGSFDASSPHFPHVSRAELERAVYDEEEKRTALRAAGERLLRMLGEFTEKTLPGLHQVAEATEAVEVVGPDAKRSVLDLTSRDVLPQAPFRNVWARIASETTTLLGRCADGSWVGLAFGVSDHTEPSRWLRVTETARIPGLASLPLPAK